MFWPQSGEYANTTSFVTQPGFEQELEFATRARIDEVALRPLMASLTRFWRSVIADFDDLFGGRA